MKKTVLFTGIFLILPSLIGCKNNSNKDTDWSKWFDNGDGTHTRHNLNDITQTETEEHHFELVRYILEPTEVAPGSAQYQCVDCGAKEEKKVPPTGNYVFDQKIVDEKYLCERYSEHSASYYMSSIEGAYGNPDYVFEKSSLPDAYTEVDYIQGDGRQWIDTGVKNDGHHTVSINGTGRNSKIPSNYQEIEYIEATGEQEIDLGYKFDIAKDSYEVTFQSTELKQNGMIIATGHGSRYLWLYHYSKGKEIGQYIKSGERKTTGKIPIDDSKHSVVYSNNTLTIDGVKSGENDKTGISNENVYLFSWGGGYFYKGKIFKFKLYKEDNLVRDLIPVQRLSDGVVGLFDIVQETFLRSQNNISFLGGPFVSSSSTGRLPVDYQEVEFVESTGCQMINTGVVGAARWIFDIEYNSEHIQERQLMGYGGAGSEYWGISDGKWKMSQWAGSDVDVVGRNIYTVNYVHEQVTHYLNNEYLYLHSYDTRADEKECTLFGLPSGSFANYAKLYSCKVYNEENTQLIRDFVPCYKMVDGVGGLYDLVTNRFYASTGEENLKCGDEVFYDMNKKLPQEYEELTFIASTGTQFIDTGIICKPGIKAEIEMRFVEVSNTKGQWSTVFGDNLKNGNETFNIWADNNDNSFKVYGCKNYEEGAILPISAGQKEIISIESADSVVDIGNSLYIFACNNPGSYEGYNQPFELYSMKMYEDDELVRDFVPCNKKDNDESGLYDLVSNQFFANIGTGSFVKGSSVEEIDKERDEKAEKTIGIPEYYYQLNYIESTSIQSINTGVSGNALIDMKIKYNISGDNQIMGYGTEDGEYFGIDASGNYLGSTIDAGNIDRFICDFGNEMEGYGKISINEWTSESFEIKDITEKSLQLF